MLKYFMLLLALLVTLHGQGTDNRLTFKHITIDDGLSQSVVYDMMQDSRGFVWIATGNGLNRYDGRDMKEYLKRPGDSLSLSGNIIRSVFEDARGDIWVGTTNGLNKLILMQDPQTGEELEGFQQFLHRPGDSTSIGSNFVWRISAGAAGDFWVGGKGSVQKVRARYANQQTALKRGRVSVEFQSFIHNPNNPEGISNHHINGILEDSPGYLWLTSLGGGLQHLEVADGSVKHFRHQKDNPNSPPTNYLMRIYKGASGKLWIGSYGGGLICFRPEINTFKQFFPDDRNANAISDQRIFAMLEHNNLLWLGSFGGGLNRFDIQNEKFYHYRHIDFDPQSLSSDYIRCLMLDRSNNLWLGTNSGINIADLKPAKFAHYKHNPHNDNTPAHNYTLSLLNSHSQGREELWIGHNEGVDRFDRQSGRYRHYKIHHRSGAAGSGFIYALLEDKAGDIWLGSFGGGIYRFNRKSDSFQQFQHDANNPNSISTSRVHALWQDPTGYIWVGSINGLNRLNPQTGQFKRFYHDEANPNTLNGNRVQVLVEHVDGRLLVGTASGLNFFDLKTHRVERLPDDQLSHPSVNAIFVDEKETVWIGTGYGLNRYDCKTGVVQQYFESDGLPGNTICKILGDWDGNLWISTHRGLAKFDPSANEEALFRQYDTGDGLQSNEFNPGSGFRDNTNRELFFGGVNGFNRFEPAKVQDNITPPPVALTAFRKFGKVIRSGLSLTGNPTIELAHTDDFFSFEFTALDFSNPEKNQYAYMLEGFDRNWNYSGTRAFANYTNMDPGEYTFRVKASNNDGIWNESGAKLNIIVHPAIWQTWWFRFLALLALGGLLFALHRYRMDKLLEIERVRVRIASDLHDDVGSTLTKIALYSDLIGKSDDRSDRDGMLNRIGTMSRELVVAMSDIVWSIDARNDSVEDLLDRMRDFAVSIFSAKNIEYVFNIENLDTAVKLPIQKRQNIYLIFKEAVNNIARHAGATRVVIHLRNDDKRFRMSIEDNGHGFNGVGRKSGHGLTNMKMRAERIGGEVRFLDNEKESSGVQVLLETEAI